MVVAGVAIKRVVAVASFDQNVAEQFDAPEVQGVGRLAAEQPDKPARLSGINGFDAGLRAEVGQSDVHIAGANSLDHVETDRAGVRVGVVAVEAGPAARQVASDAVGVGAFAAVHGVIAQAARDQVVVGAAVDRVVAVSAINHKGLGRGQHDGSAVGHADADDHGR